MDKGMSGTPFNLHKPNGCQLGGVWDYIWIWNSFGKARNGMAFPPKGEEIRIEFV